MSKCEFDLNDHINVIYLKNYLLSLSSSQLLSAYCDKAKYGLFLDTVNIMNSLDNGFLLLDSDMISKIENVIFHQRFIYSDKDFTACCNEIIVFLNRMKNMSSVEKTLIQEHYLDYQEDVRFMAFPRTDDFKAAISYDAVGHYQLLHNNFSHMEEPFFLGSINYFIEQIPELFQNEDILTRSDMMIKFILEKKGFGRKMIRELASTTLDNFQKIKK